MKYYKIVTLGCKVNSYESMAMAQKLESIGYSEASEKDSPSLVIINTCSVTSNSDGKSRQMINREHKNNPNAIIVVAGCYSQLASEVVSKLDGVNIVIGTQYRKDIDSLVLEYEKNKTQIIRVDNSMKIDHFESLNVTSYNDNTRAFLKIQDGCNNFCSYCIIPYARGPIRSRDKNEVLEEAKALVKSGFKELVLTGIHTAGYGLDLDNYSFTDLLHDLLDVLPDYERVRISSIEESEITDEFIDLLSKDSRIVPHLHIPLQSGSDTVLKRMNRKYLTNDYYKTICKIRKAIPDIAITTDVIVGFPNESIEEFNETKEFIKKVNFSMLHVFPYSRRSGTVADKMPNQIDPKIKKERVSALISLSKELANSYISTYKGKTVKVLFEEIKGEYMEGHAPNYFRIAVKANANYLNTIKDVIIKEPAYPVSIGIIKEE